MNKLAHWTYASIAIGLLLIAVVAVVAGLNSVFNDFLISARTFLMGTTLTEDAMACVGMDAWAAYEVMQVALPRALSTDTHHFIREATRTIQDGCRVIGADTKITIAPQTWTSVQPKGG
jgi:hypothetical protein